MVIICVIGEKGGVKMEAGYLVGKFVEDKLKELGTNGVIAWLSGSVGKMVAKKIVTKVAQAGVTAAAGYIAGLLGASGSIAGPLGAIVGGVGGWL